MDRQLIGKEDTFMWLLRGHLQREIGSEIIAAQDQVLQNKYHAIKLLQTETDSTCRLFKNLMRKYNTSYQHTQ
jgi:hypothetical protein